MIETSESISELSKGEVNAERVRHLLSYDPASGVFHWRVAPKRGRPERPEGAGAVDSSGYIIITIDQRPYKAHRLAWLYVYGVWPTKALDHANGDPGDNRLANLREATQTQNQANKRISSHNKAGLKGVHWYEPMRAWRASISVNYKKIHLGNFPTAEEAHAAYRAAATKLHGEFARFE